MQSIAHGVVRLEQLTPEYGAERRRLRVLKYRGVGFRGGYHDFIIRTGGLEVFPRLVARASTGASPCRQRLPSGIAELDELLGGGIERGTSTLIIGAAGTGKSTLAAQFVGRGGRARRARRDVHLRRERRTRCSRGATASASTCGRTSTTGAVTIQQVDPAELSPGEFANAIRRAVEQHAGARSS